MSHFLPLFFILFFSTYSNAFALIGEGVIESPRCSSTYSAVSDPVGDGLTESQFNDVIDRLEAIYSKQATQTIEVDRFWDIKGEKDSAIRLPFLTQENPVIKITGLIPRSGLVTPDAFALLVCHEFGHHLAGGPRVGTRKLTQWSSAEGQADYWATSECLKKYMQNDDNTLIMKNLGVPSSIKEKCDKNFSNQNDALICYRIGLATVSIGNYFAHLGGKIDIQCKAPPTKVLIRSFRQDNFRDQCRVDTFLAGSLCNTDVPDQGCAEDGARPSCWFVE